MLPQHHKHSWLSYFFATGVAVSFGVALAFLVTTGVNNIFAVTSSVVRAEAVLAVDDNESLFDQVDLKPVGNWFKDRFAMVRLGSVGSQKINSSNFVGKEVVVDLTTMKLTLHQNDKVVAQFDVVSKGKPGSPWETPPGAYSIKTKTLKHFSSIGEVWMPYSMQFYGNFFIHGWPYHDDGTVVPKGYSGGCIRLTTEDAAKVFAFVDQGTVVTVNGGTPATANVSNYYRIDPFNLTPDIDAKAFLLADIETGDIIAAKNADKVLPIASLTKLVTALVSLETVNQFQTAVVTQAAVDTFGGAGSLRAGQKLPTGELIYPLLLESSNDASEVLARHIGRDNFINQMNVKVKAIGLNHTTFADPSGILADNSADTKDLFSLLKYVYQYKRYVFDITRLPDHGLGKERWVNNNKFVTNEYYIGGKNGHTTAAGGTFAGVFALPLSEFATRTVAVIILGSDNTDNDVKKALDYLTGNIYYANSSSGQPKILNSQATTSLVFVGDIMLDRGVKWSVAKNGAGSYDYMFHRASFLNKADIAFANLEGPVSDRGLDRHNLYSFRMEPKVVGALANAGLDVLSIANNHVGDWGYDAFVDTINNLRVGSLVYVGGGLNKAEAEAVKIIEKNGTRFGFVGFSDVGPNDLMATSDRAGILIASDESVARVVSAAAKQCDILIASFHFGEEYKLTATDRQKKLARLAVDSGAKIVVGHHPHVIGPVESYKGGVIAYSLGNFIFDQYFSADTMTGGVLNIEVVGKEISRVATSTVGLNSFFVPELNQP